MTKSHENISYLNQSTGTYEIEPYLEFDNPVREDGLKTIGRPEHHRYVTYHEHQVTMEDGAKYLVTTSEIPDKFKRDSSDIINLETTAWLTQRQGMNRRRMAVLAKYAMPTVFISVQQNKKRFGDLTKNAHNGLEIAKAMAEIYDFDRNFITTQGVSRGAMTALTETAVAAQHDVRVGYTDSIVPCFPDGLKAADLADYLRLPSNELSTLQAVRDVPLRYLRRYPRTLDLNFFQHIKEVPTLLSGAVGHQIRRHMDPDTFAHVTAYEGDIMSQGQHWQELLNQADYPNIIFDLKEGGGHLSSVGHDSFSDWQSRLGTITEILHENPARRRLGSQALRLLAAERNPAFRQQPDPSNYQELLAS